MKALYKITFYEKARPGTSRLVESDTRQVMFNAAQGGFHQAVRWADDHRSPNEWVGSVSLVAHEQL